MQHLWFFTSSLAKVSERKKQGSPTPTGKDPSLPTWTSWAVWSEMKGSVQERRLMQQDVEGIVPYTGAITNMCGKKWLHRVERLGAEVQRRPSLHGEHT
eukprot:4031378-Amphidinium_carterae.2